MARIEVIVGLLLLICAVFPTALGHFHHQETFSKRPGCRIVAPTVNITSLKRGLETQVRGSVVENYLFFIVF